MCIFCERAQNQLADGLTPQQKREVEECERLKELRVRATILTGFLGAGKTTFLNFILKSLAHKQKFAVVQNEFGSVPVDDLLMDLERSDAETIVMPNGCLCCRVRGDLVDALRRLAARHADVAAEGSDATQTSHLKLDSLIIECSGLSEVMPVAQTFFADPFVQAAFQLDGVVCLCDAGNFEALEGGGITEGSAGAEVSKLLRDQLGVSDVCLLNKCDLVDSTSRDRIAARIRQVNPAVKVVPCRNGKVNLGQVLKVNSFSLDTALSLDAHFLENKLKLSDDGNSELGHGHGHGHGHEEAHGAAESHAHSSFGSLGLEVPGTIDLDAFKSWLKDVVLKHGEALVRAKGVLHVGSSGENIVVVQGVGGHMEIGEECKAPSSGAIKSRLVLIGRLLSTNLRMELREGFIATACGVAGVPAKI